jgi:hypothetical protein
MPVESPFGFTPYTRGDSNRKLCQSFEQISFSLLIVGYVIKKFVQLLLKFAVMRQQIVKGLHERFGFFKNFEGI